MPAEDEPQWILPTDTTSDPADVRTNTATPADEPEEAHPVTDAEMSGEIPAEPLPEFDPRCREAFEGLAFMGALTKTFDWMGHKFTVRTLKMDELLQVAQVHSKYAQTIGDVKAYQAAIVAATIQLVDAKPLPVPSFTDETSLDARFNFVTTKWYPWTFDAVYTEYLALEAKVLEVMEAMGEALGSKASTPGSNLASV